MNIEIPEVSKASGINQVFEPNRIFSSLIKETTLSNYEASLITEATTRLIVSLNLKFLSGPLIREIVNVQLLQHGFEKARLEYTRIGFPYHDLTELLKQKEYLQKIIQHVVNEYEAVKKLIEER